MFDEILTEVRSFAVDQKFDDDVCVVGMDYVGMAKAKVG
jgi:serine phosphatase RsbU (regulator of sigma subunit)